MSLSLENAFFQLSIKPSTSTWNLFGYQASDISLEGVYTTIHYRLGRSRFRTQRYWSSLESAITEADSSPHGRLKACHVKIGPERNGLQYMLSLALPEAHPALLWKLAIENRGSQPILIDRIDFLDTSNRSGNRRPAMRNIKADAFFSNGWQSWSHTGAFKASDRPRRTRLGPFAATMCYNRTTPRPYRSGHFASDMFGVLVDRSRRDAVLFGFLSQKEQFGSIEVKFNAPSPMIRLWAHGDGARLDPGQQMDTDWACLFTLDIDDPDPFGPYLDAVSREHYLPKFKPQSPNNQFSDNSESKQLVADIPTGWCSWYQFFQDVTAVDIRNNLTATRNLQADLPLAIFQIDDGFEAQVGDWLDFSHRFPGGTAPLAAEIKEAGFTPGLWLAPFIVHPKSRLFDDHPDWLLRGSFGRPINAGYVWDAFTTALDLTQPDALAYTAEVVHTAVHDWGYPYLKLDFLYAAALSGRRYEPRLTPAQVLRKGLETIRAAVGEETTLLGCGCPLGSAIGIVDAMRIGADVDVHWPATFKGIKFFFQDEPNMPSARNAIQNALTRAPLHRRWWVNDPDCLLIRPETNLTLAEVQSLATVIALTGGSLFLSDDLPNLPPNRLKIAELMLPVLGVRPRIMDWADSPTPGKLRLDLENKSGKWHLLAIFNWDDQEQDMVLRLSDFDLADDQAYFARSFWRALDGEYEPYKIQDGAIPSLHLPAHGVALFAVRPMTVGSPTYIGSDLHISQGLEVASWQPDGDGLRMHIERPGSAQGTIVFSLPQKPRTALSSGKPCPFKAGEDSLYYFPLELYQSTELQLSW
jgi:alpha-galactosidase